MQALLGRIDYVLGMQVRSGTPIVYFTKWRDCTLYFYEKQCYAYGEDSGDYMKWFSVGVSDSQEDRKAIPVRLEAAFLRSGADAWQIVLQILKLKQCAPPDFMQYAIRGRDTYYDQNWNRYRFQTL